MSTIKISTTKLESAAYAWMMREYKTIRDEQQKMIDEHLSGFFWRCLIGRPKPTRIEASIWLNKNSRGWWQILQVHTKKVQKYYDKLRLACQHAHDNVVTLDVEDVYMIFGESD